MSSHESVMKKRNAMINSMANHHSVTEDGFIFGDSIQSPNSSYYINLPHVIRRCYYLDSNELNILAELYSWMNTEGIAQVEQGLIAIKTGIPLRTVKQKMTGKTNSLKSKGFISVSKKKRTNVYTIQKLDFNPYIILSEMAHSFAEHNYYKGFLRSLEWEEVQETEEVQDSKEMQEAESTAPTETCTLNWIIKGEQSITEWRKKFVECFSRTVTDKSIYMKYVESMLSNPKQDYSQLCTMFWNDLYEGVVKYRLASK